ncbi:LysR family transcriptional regulator [Variovorax sp. LjRoot178]|uniref:LysR family transcriptional regulator n=1 Tax=Variovorax sp. LjRoot178 TaxID=3342277 RepID=UPI003ECD4F21
MDELARIQTFIKVVEAGSFSAAARDSSSTSSVARQIKSLEDELGVRLLNRNTRGISLSEPGRIFYERACKLAVDLNNAKSEAQSFQQSVKGLLKISLRVSTGTTIIIPALPAFLERYPELSLDVTLTDERQDLVANHIDVAVWMGQLPDSEIVARRLIPSQRIVCGASSYFNRHGVPVSPRDLERHSCLLFTAPQYGNTWRFNRNGVQEEITVAGKLRTGNVLALLSGALSGLGMIMVHDWTVRSQIEAGALVRVLQDYAVSPISTDADLHVVYPSSRGMSMKVRVFVDFLVQLFERKNAPSADMPGLSV